MAVAAMAMETVTKKASKSQQLDFEFESTRSALALKPKVDVYAYAHLLYRVWTAGQPDPTLAGLNPVQVMHKLHIDGYRPALPPGLAPAPAPAPAPAGGAGGRADAGESVGVGVGDDICMDMGWPKGVCNIVSRAWQADPNNRPTFAQMLAVLEQTRNEVVDAQQQPKNHGDGHGAMEEEEEKQRDSETIERKISVGMGLPRTSSEFVLVNPLTITTAASASPLRFTKENQGSMLSLSPTKHASAASPHARML